VRLLTGEKWLFFLIIAVLYYSMSLFIVLCLGWLVSFLGQLPLGTMSITATQITVEENFANAWRYSIGVTLIELLYVRFTIAGVAWILRHTLFFKILNWVTVVLFLTLGTATIIHALKQQGEKKALVLNNKINRFWLGASMSALNPAQIPFWFIWSSYLINLHLLRPVFIEFNLFSAGCALGTISGLAAYMYGGNWVITKVKAGTKLLNLIMGGIFIIAALAQLYRIFFAHEVLK
jgi:threonine/homoserine/homoserine lactone efflux protein